MCFTFNCSSHLKHLWAQYFTALMKMHLKMKTYTRLNAQWIINSLSIDCLWMKIQSASSCVYNQHEWPLLICDRNIKAKCRYSFINDIILLIKAIQSSSVFSKKKKTAASKTKNDRKIIIGMSNFCLLIYYVGNL